MPRTSIASRGKISDGLGSRTEGPKTFRSRDPYLATPMIARGSERQAALRVSSTTGYDLRCDYVHTQATSRSIQYTES